MAAVCRSLRRSASLLRKSMYQSPATYINGGSCAMSTSEHNVNKKLDGKVAIVTGAAGAIGLTTAKLFAAHGAQVILTDIVDEAGHERASEIGSNAHYRHCDVTKEEDVASTVDFAVEKFGKLDIMFNNAGTPTAVETFETMSIENYDLHHALMVRGVVVGIKHAARVMIPAKRGVIVNTASICGVLANTEWPLSYSICKFTLPGLTQLAAAHLGKHGIRVNAISPHVIPNPLALDFFRSVGVNATFQDMEKVFIDHSALHGRTITNEDVSNGVLFLSSDDSGYVSGQNLVVDGGWCSQKYYGATNDLLKLRGNSQS